MDKDYDGIITTSIESVVNWSRKFSLFQYPCYGMLRYGIHGCSMLTLRYFRFGAEIPRFSPRQADLLWVVGTITHKMSPVLKTIYDQMADPKWVIAFGTCANGRVLKIILSFRVDRLIPVDLYIAGCPPRPKQYLTD